MLITCKVVPRAVDYFTGKALEYDSLDEFDDDDDDMEDGSDDDLDEVCLLLHGSVIFVMMANRTYRSPMMMISLSRSSTSQSSCSSR